MSERTPPTRFAAKLKALYVSTFPGKTHAAWQRRKAFERLAVGEPARAVIVIVPDQMRVDAGHMSVVSIAMESEKLRPVHDAEVFCCTCPGDPPLLRFAGIPDGPALFDFEFILGRLARGADVLVHVPETCLSRFLSLGAPSLENTGFRLRFNVLLRSTEPAPLHSDIASLQKIGPVTVCSARAAHASAEMQQDLGCLVHHLRAWPCGIDRRSSAVSDESDESEVGLDSTGFEAALRSYYGKYFPHPSASSGSHRLRWASKYYVSNYVHFIGIGRERRKYLGGIDVNAHARTILLIVPGRNLVNGGIMSIIRIAKESEKLQSLHGANVFVCTCPGDAPLLRYTKFPNDRILLDFKAVVDRLSPAREVLVHIPELYTGQFVSCAASLIAARDLRWQFNIMLQNIDMIPQRGVIDRLREFGAVTVTTAHDAYANRETQERLGCAVHHLSAWMSPIEYERRAFADRENIVVVSPDPHERKDWILAELAKHLPEFRFVTVWNMAYMDYRELTAKAKFSLTFGEGYDGYFCEMIVGGGIGCAVYNERFFTEEFATLPFVYPTWDDLVSRLPGDIRAANGPDEFARQNGIADRMLSRRSSAEKFRENLVSYYEKYFPRQLESGQAALADAGRI